MTNFKIADRASLRGGFQENGREKRNINDSGRGRAHCRSHYDLMLTQRSTRGGGTQVQEREAANKKNLVLRKGHKLEKGVLTGGWGKLTVGVACVKGKDKKGYREGRGNVGRIVSHAIRKGNRSCRINRKRPRKGSMEREKEIGGGPRMRRGRCKNIRPIGTANFLRGQRQEEASKTKKKKISGKNRKSSVRRIVENGRTGTASRRGGFR